MNPRKERRKALLGDQESARVTRGRNFLEADLTTEPATRSAVIDSILNNRKERLDAAPAFSSRTGKTPTFEETRTKFSTAAQQRAGEIPKVTFGIPDRKVSELVMSFSPQETDAAARDALEVFLFGQQNIKDLGKTPDGMVDYAKEKGLVGFLYGTTLKTAEQRTAERYEKLVQTGVEPDRAFQIARGWADGGAMPTDITEAEQRSMRNFTIIENAFIGLELADLLLVGKPINAGLKTMTRGEQATLFQEVGKAASAADARAIIVAKYPQLAGTEGIEELIQIARSVSERDNWSKVLSETKTGKRILEGTQGTERVVTTEAQRVSYENGIPLVRGGEVAPTTVRRGFRDVPDQTADAVALRREINDVLAGQTEAMRLSNLDVFADEIKAGALPFKATVDEPVKLFVSDEIADVTRLRAGDRLATSKQVIEEVSENAKAKILEVMPDDVVRLQDGTFVYAPKKDIGRGVQATLRSLRGSQRSKVAGIEKSQEISTLKKQLDSETQRFDASLAREERKNVARAKRAADVSRARQVLQNEETQAKRLLDDVATSREARITEIRETAKAANTAVREAQKTVRQLVTSIGKIPRQIARERTKAREAIERIRGLKTVDSKEKTRRMNKVRKDRDREIARLEKEKKKLQSQTTKARTKLDKARENTIDKNVAIRNARSEARDRINQIRSDSSTALREAKKVLSEQDKVKAKARVTKAKETNKEQITDQVTSLRETFKTFSNENPSVGDTGSGAPIKQVGGKGKEVSNQIIKSYQDKVKWVQEEYKKRGLSLGDLPATHQAIGNDTLIKKAFADVVDDPYAAYSKVVTGGFPEETTRAAYVIALMESDFVLSNATRMANLNRAFVEGTSRFAQELQSVKNMNRMDYINIVGRFSRQADELLKARGVNVEEEATKLLKLFDGAIDDVATVSKAGIAKAIDSITCKV